MPNNFDQAPCLFFSSTDEGTLLEVNDRLCSVLQYNREEIIGKKLEVLFTVPTRIFQQTHFFPLLKMQGHAEEIFITLQKKDGEYLPVLINAERKLINDVAVNLHVGIEVHNRKKFEEELIAAKKTAEAALHENTALAQAKQQLQQRSEELDTQIQKVNKQNEELRQFNRVVTHDMQEPLRKLSLFSGMLQESQGKQEQTKLVERIKKVSEQMRNILLGLQQYVWLNESPPVIKSIELAKLLSKVQQQIENDFPEVELVVEITDTGILNGDEEQMQLLLYQLFSNAIRFRKTAGKAFVRVRSHTVQRNQFRATEGRYKYIDFVRVEVEDAGIGFNPAYKTQVFELFKRLHDESGRGVGLALCKRIVDNHHGTISIDSKVNEGTTVTIDLPVPSLSDPERNLRSSKIPKDIHE